MGPPQSDRAPARLLAPGRERRMDEIVPVLQPDCTGAPTRLALQAAEAPGGKDSRVHPARRREGLGAPSLAVRREAQRVNLPVRALLLPPVLRRVPAVLTAGEVG